ncbi:hypothetical protein LJR175_008435 [Variovorax sp. LjRoot175]|uniref:hypothetical protein n=1 Tax=Variovorax sp. LjRoot175 TaxID=3342276 RepID=UPI003ECFACE9
MNHKMTNRESRLADTFAKSPAAAGPDFINWLTMWSQSGVREEGGPRKPFAFVPFKERQKRDILDEDNTHPMRRMLSHHPGAPMAFAEICRQPSAFLRLRALIEYLKAQSDRPSVTNASDEGSVTAYVSPLHINEVMRGFDIEDSDEAEQEITRLRAIARERVMQDLLGIAGSASEEAFSAAAGTWLRKEYTRRQAAEKQLRGGASSTASSSTAGSSRERANDQAIALPTERPGHLAFRGAPTSPDEQQPSDAAATSASQSAAERPFGFGFRRPAG